MLGLTSLNSNLSGARPTCWPGYQISNTASTPPDESVSLPDAVISRDLDYHCICAYVGLGTVTRREFWPCCLWSCTSRPQPKESSSTSPSCFTTPFNHIDVPFVSRGGSSNTEQQNLVTASAADAAPFGPFPWMSTRARYQQWPQSKLGFESSLALLFHHRVAELSGCTYAHVLGHLVFEPILPETVDCDADVPKLVASLVKLASVGGKGTERVSKSAWRVEMATASVILFAKAGAENPQPPSSTLINCLTILITIFKIWRLVFGRRHRGPQFDSFWKPRTQ